MENCTENAKALKEGLEKTGKFEIVSKDIGVPLVAFSLKDSSMHTVFDIADNLRRFGWIVPAYTMPANAEHIAVLRVVIREDFSRSLAERLITDIQKVLADLDHRATKIITSVSLETAKNADVAVVKKTVEETEQEIISHWRSLVNKKKTSGVC